MNPDDDSENDAVTEINTVGQSAADAINAARDAANQVKTALDGNKATTSTATGTKLSPTVILGGIAVVGFLAYIFLKKKPAVAVA